MKKKLIWVFDRLHLILSLIIVVPTAIIYGYAPSTLLSQYLNIPVTTIDLSNLLRAIMCLYLGFSFFWFLAILNTKYWKTGTQLNILFMLSLALGRILSMFFDGIPSNGYIFGVLAELFLGLFSVFQLKNKSFFTFK